MWGIANKGFTCKACGFNCHAKCEMKIAPNCSKVKGKINPQPVMSSAASAFSISNRSGRTNSVSESTRSIPTTLTASNISHSYSNTTIPAASTPGELRSIYSYEAQNSDELSIKEGDILQIVEHDDGTGWIKAKLGNQIGLIPANYVEHLEDTTSFDDTYDRDASVIDEPTIYTVPSTQPIECDIPAPPPPPPVEAAPVPAPLHETVVALYDFEAVNAEELNIKEGDVIIVTKKDDSGWWEGSLNGQTGVFPANYVEVTNK
jgi:bifunctional DNA-binding transcriptional regulator/antitoxin component of YhaV-PrlF toxin-antitoxin module